MPYANVELDNLSNTDINADLRIFANATEIWRADQDIGLTRDQFAGVATLTPAALHNPDYVTVTLPRYIGCDFVVAVTGTRGTATNNSTNYEIYADWFAPIYACTEVISAFSAYVTWHVYDPDTNKPYVPPAGAGPWNNLRQLCADMTTQTGKDWDVDDIPLGVKRVYWIVRWPL